MNIVFKCRILHVLLLTVSMPMTFAVNHENRPDVTPQAIQDYLELHEAQWLEKLPSTGTRLFYQEEDWPRVLAELQSDEGLRPQFRDAVFETAARLAKAPTPPYVTPEEVSANIGQGIFSTAQELWQRRVGDNIFLLALAGRLSDDPDYRRQLHDTVIAGCNYPHWGRRTLNMDLAAGHMVRAIALAWDWHRELFNAEEQDLIRTVVRERANALLYALSSNGNFWSRSYTENHNHVSVCGLGLAGLAFLGDIPEAREWLAAACINFDYVAEYSTDDGSSAEGVPYWTYSVSFILQFIEATRHITESGELYADPFLQNAAAYRIGSSTPGFAGTLPWGDAPFRDYYGPQHLLARLASQYDDSSAQYLMEHIPFSPRGGSDVTALLLMWYNPSIIPKVPSELDYHAADSDIVSTRSGWGNSDYLLTIKSGFTNRNHSHLDAGALAFIFGNDWLLLAPGYGKGAGQRVFWQSGGPRWEFSSNSTESHCTLLINGENQRFDKKARSTIDSYVTTLGQQWTSIDLSNAYQGDAEVQRKVLHVRDDYILVLDEVTAEEPVTVEWLAQVSNSATVSEAHIKLPSRAGDLLINLLQPGTDRFSTRELTSPKIDNPNKSQRSYTITRSGESVDFAVLMQPQFRNVPEVDLQASVKIASKGHWSGEIASPKWSDSIVVNNTIEPIEWDSKSLVLPELQAQVALARLSEGNLTRIFAVNAAELVSGVLVMKPENPVSLALENDGASSWVLDLDTPFSGEIHVAEGLHIFDQQLESVKTAETTHLPRARYYLAPDKVAAKSLKDRTEQFFVSHSIPALPVVKGRPLSPAPADITIGWEAEKDFSATNSQLTVSSKKGASKGLALKGFGNSGPTEALQWKVNVKRAGTYQMKIRYCIADHNTYLSVLVDGAAPSEEALSIRLEPTGGWSNEKDDWKEVLLCDADGQPISIPLTMGEHIIELTALSNPVNIDYLSLQGF